jgi:hypothetical protein
MVSKFICIVVLSSIQSSPKFQYHLWSKLFSITQCNSKTLIFLIHERNSSLTTVQFESQDSRLGVIIKLVCFGRQALIWKTTTT